MFSSFTLPFALRRGYALLKKGMSDDAFACFSELTRKYPRAPQPFFEVGKAHFKKGDLPAARENLLAALDRSPADDILEGILEMTNWWMISSPSFFNSHPSFSPDGKWLLFCSARQDTNGDGKINGSDRAGIYLADVASGVVTELVSNTLHNSSPIWSPDGKSVLYFCSLVFGSVSPGDTSNRQLLLLDLESREEVLIVPASLSPRYPAFTPDGKRLIVCTVDAIGGPSGLSVIDLETRVRRTLTSHAWEHTYPQVSADGRWLLYVSWRNPDVRTGATAVTSNPRIYLMDLATEKERLLVGDEFSNAYPRFSQRGDAVVYLSRRRDTNADGKIDHLDNYGVYTMQLAQRTETCVSSDDHANKFPCWSADGRWIVFLGHWASPAEKPAWWGEDYFELKGIYRVPAQGGEPKRVVSDKFFGSRFCEVSPQGSLVAYVSWRPTTSRGLYIADYLKLPSLDQLRGFIQNNLS